MPQANVSVLNEAFDVIYQPDDSDLPTIEQCIDGNNRTNIPIRQGVRYTTEVRMVSRLLCGIDVSPGDISSTAGKICIKINCNKIIIFPKSFIQDEDVVK